MHKASLLSTGSRGSKGGPMCLTLYKYNIIYSY